MHWNHRVVRVTSQYETILTIAEVYYNDDTGVPFAYNDPFMCSETLDGLTELLNRMHSARLQPVLNYPEDFDLSAVDADDDDDDDEDTVTPYPV